MKHPPINVQGYLNIAENADELNRPDEARAAREYAVIMAMCAIGEELREIKRILDERIPWIGGRP